MKIDFNVPMDTSDNDLWEMIPEFLLSWSRKGGVAKTSRWFSWNEEASVRLQEWAAARMIYEWYFAAESPPDPDELPAVLKFSQYSGLKMCYLSHSWWHWQNAHIILIVQKSCHEWYSHQTHFIKSPEDGLADLLHSIDNWSQDSSLQGLAQCMSNCGLFDSIASVSPNADEMADIIGHYCTQCLGNRCGSFAEKFCSPPCCYVGILSDDVDKQQEALSLMKSDWVSLKALEASDAGAAQELARDLLVTFDAPIRFMVQVFEAHSWRINPEGVQLLELLAGGFPDTKVIEDIHQSLRVATGPKAAKRLSGTCVQEVVQNSQSLESRNIAHPCQVDEALFLDLWHRTQPKFSCKDLKVSKNSLPRVFTKILGQKTWPTISEVELEKSAAAWVFLRHYVNDKLADQCVRLQECLLRSSLCLLILFVTCYY